MVKSGHAPAHPPPPKNKTQQREQFLNQVQRAKAKTRVAAADVVHTPPLHYIHTTMQGRSGRATVSRSKDTNGSRVGLKSRPKGWLWKDRSLGLRSLTWRVLRRQGVYELSHVQPRGLAGRLRFKQQTTCHKRLLRVRKRFGGFWQLGTSQHAMWLAEIHGGLFSKSQPLTNMQTSTTGGL